MKYIFDWSLENQLFDLIFVLCKDPDTLFKNRGCSKIPWELSLLHSAADREKNGVRGLESQHDQIHKAKAIYRFRCRYRGAS